MFFLFCLLDHVAFTWKFLFLLYPTVLLTVFNLGVGMILSAWFVFFRDMQYLWSIFTQLLMYLSAVFYTIDSFSHPIQCAFYANPIYVFIRYFRKIVLESTIPSIWFHGLLLVYAVIALGLGCLVYKKENQRFLYYL